MIILEFILVYIIYVELLGFFICGWFTNDIEKVKNLLTHKHWINPLQENMIVINFDEAYISKNINETYWKWYISDEKGKRKRVFRWSKLSKYLDTVYSNLKFNQ